MEDLKIEEHKDSKESIKKQTLRKKNRILIIISIPPIALAICEFILLLYFCLPSYKYNRAVRLRDSNKTAELDRLMLNLNRGDIRYFRNKTDKNNGIYYFLSKDGKCEYCLGNNSKSNVDIDEDCRIICGNAFSDCHVLYGIYFYYNIENVGKNAFKETNNIEIASIPASIAKYIPKSHLKYVTIISGDEIEDYAFMGSINLLHIYINDGMKRIGNYAFLNCISLGSITLSDSIETIGEGAFRNCVNLNNFKPPKNLTVIEKCTFYNCKSIGNNRYGIYFYNITTIKTGAFYNCESLTNIVLPETLTTIEDGAFHNAYIEKVFYAGGTSGWSTINIGSDNDSIESNTVYYYSRFRPTDTTHKYWYYYENIPTPWN